MHKLSLGFATYGSTKPRVWGQWLAEAAHLHELGIDLTQVLVGDGMATDFNRNMVVKDFLHGPADWLMWWDSDTVPPFQATHRLLQMGKTLVTGVYYLKKEDTAPTLYIRQEHGRYAHPNPWEVGEIIEVDAAGHGCLLVHRSVYEDIKTKFVVLQKPNGATFLHPKDEIKGVLAREARHKTDGQVIDGVLRTRVTEELVTKPDEAWPFYALENGRTEDMLFFECAQHAGHHIYCDTSVECRHYGMRFWDGTDWRRRLPGLYVADQVPLVIRPADENYDQKVWEERPYEQGPALSGT
jgi:hypothetical protein